jgi:uncharacterized protein (DUF433 family)
MTLTLQAIPVPLCDDGAGGYRVGNTRVSLDTVLHSHLRGMTAEEIVASLDTLDVADVYAVLAWAVRNPGEASTYLERREQEAQRLRAELEAAGHTSPPGTLRAKLQARQAERGQQGATDAPISD